MSIVHAVPPVPAQDPLPRQAVTQEEANAIAQHFELDDVDHIQVAWVDGHKGRQALLWPIKSKWVGYVMVVALLLGARVARPILDPVLPGEPPRGRQRAVAALVVAR